MNSEVSKSRGNHVFRFIESAHMEQNNFVR